MKPADAELASRLAEIHQELHDLAARHQSPFVADLASIWGLHLTYNVPRSTNLPDLTDPRVAPRVALVGAAFDLAPDGAPGVCNHVSAGLLNDALELLPEGSDTFLGVQWEQAVALAELRGGDQSVIDCVATPPPFKPREIARSSDFAAKFSEPNGPNAEGIALVHQALGEVAQDELRNPSQRFKLVVTTALNAILQDARFYEAFCALDPPISITNLERPGLGVEQRELPNPEEYPDGLARYQAMRVNRLIIEELFSKDLLRRGEYLGTREVFDEVVHSILQRPRPAESVILFGHPDHLPRCRAVFMERAWEAGWELPCDEIHYWDCRGVPYPHGAGAQSWCCCAEAFRKYENVTRLAELIRRLKSSGRLT